MDQYSRNHSELGSLLKWKEKKNLGKKPALTEGGGKTSKNVSTPISWPMGMGERRTVLH